MHARKRIAKRTTAGVVSEGEWDARMQHQFQPPTLNKMTKERNAVLPNALRIPCMTKMSGKRIVLASASPRRKEVFRTFVR
jgi:hypothetical protein